ncbi:MAG: NACHT domain-containing protein [Prochlorothrix sp.]
MAMVPGEEDNMQGSLGDRLEAGGPVGELEEILDLEEGEAGDSEEIAADDGSVESETLPQYTAERQFVQSGTQKFAQALIQWAPLGGSGFVTASHLVQQDWVQAGLMFPVLIATTGWAAFTKGFLEQWATIAEQLGQSSADVFGNWVKAAPEALKWKLSGFENKYLECQAAACRDYEVEGVQSAVFKPQLAEVFVLLELSDLFVRGQEGQNLPMLPGLRRSEAELLRLSEREGLSIWDLLKRVESVPAYGQMVIKAWGGYGKTTLLRHLTFVYSQRRQKQYGAPKLVPFLLYLRDYQQVLGQDKAPTLARLITQGHLPKLPGGKALTPPPNWAENLLGSGGALVMLDGFDEVQAGNRVKMSRWIGQQMQAYPKAVFLLTSRPNAYNENYKGKRPSTSLFVKPFNAGQQGAFVRQWYLCQERYARGGRDTPEVAHAAETNAQALLDQLEQRPELKDLAQNPLLLNLIATFHRSFPSQELPRRKGELYQEIVKLQLGARPLAKRIVMPLGWEESQEVLQGLALAMVRKEWRTVGQGAVVRFFGQKLQRLNVAVSAEEFLKAVVEVSELLVEREAKEYEFAHLSFQSYLAALEVQRTRQERLLLENYGTPFWKETILLYGSQSRNPASLIRELCATQEKEAAELAYTIWQESTRQIDPAVTAEIEALRTQVQDLRFQDLEAFLKNGQWLKADKETYRLMITTVGKEEGQLFEQEELLNFPCEELLTIDGLWRKYSEDRYGFSVQKEIYARCGGILELIYEVNLKRAESTVVKGL